MAESKRKSSSKQVMDVQKSNTVATDATAKPVIVTNRQILRDPMVTSEATTPVAETKKEQIVPEPSVESKAEPVIAPLETVEAAKPETESEPEPKAAETAEAEQEPEIEPEQESEKPAEPKKPEGPVPGEVTTDAAIEAAAEDAEAKREAELQKLVDKKQYFLPINAMEQRRVEQFIALGVVICIVLGLAWLDVSLDAGLIHIDNIHALTHFFSN